MKVNPIRTSEGLTNPGFGIYVHVPFCVHKCSYCDFYSFTSYREADFSKWASRIKAEVRESAEWLASSKSFKSDVCSVFFGGGTPSLMPIQWLEEVFSDLGQFFSVSDKTEITLEANPETVNEKLLQDFLNHTPINRISLGAQSFEGKHLETLERLGSSESIKNAAKLCREKGFSNFSLDLIFGIPGQSLSEMKRDLEETIFLKPKHISFYQLTLTSGHPLYSRLPNDETTAEMYEVGRERLVAQGYYQYEISNFAQPGFECQHNLLYWNGGDFLGLGPSASSRFFWNQKFFHRKQVSEFSRYLTSAPFPAPGFDETDANQTILEATFLELRKNTGVDVDVFQERYGYDLKSAKNFPLFLRHGMLAEEEKRVWLTPRGQMLADRVTRDLVDY